MKTLALVLSVISLQAVANPSPSCQSSDIAGKANLECINPSTVGADLRFFLSPQACVNGQLTYPAYKGIVISPMGFIGRHNADQMRDFQSDSISVVYESQGTQVLPTAKMILPLAASFSDDDLVVSIQFTKQLVKDGVGNISSLAPFVIKSKKTGQIISQGNLNCFSFERAD